MKKILLTLLIIALIFPIISALTGSIGNAKIIIQTQGNVPQTVEKTILVKNINSIPVEITLSLDEDAEEFIELIDENFTLQPNENKSARFLVHIDENKNYEGKIFVEFSADGESSVILPATVIVIAEDSNSFSGADIAYILRDGNNPDSTITGLISQEGYTYEAIDDSDISSTDFSEYSMILIGNENFGSYLQYIPVNQKNALLINKYHMDYWHWDGGGASQLTSSQSRGQVINITNIVAEGVPQFFFIYSQGSTNFYHLSSLGRAPGLIGIVSPDDHESNYVIATANVGSLLRDGVRSNAKGIFFGATETDFWTQDTKNLFKNSVSWLIGDEDMDEDGYPARLDCNDHDEEINPGATEIPYDGIDQDCSDGDLRDVDHDSYEAEIVGGTDCNDNNPSINPGETESSRNCVNEAPILDREIPVISWNEDTLKAINLNSYFDDPDGNNLFYDVKPGETSDNQNIIIHCSAEGCPGGIVAFNSTENWNGEDWVIFTATDPDGLFVKSNNVTLRINPINDAPTIWNSENVSGIEGSLIKIDINATDPEGDSLTYFYEADIPLEQNGSLFSWQTEIGDSGTYTAFIGVRDSNSSTIVKEFTIEVYEKVLINEFSSDAREGANEWVEIYNIGSNSFALNECVIIDGAGNEIQLDGEIFGGKFRVFEMSNKLNNEGDLISLYCKGQLIDYVVYGNWDYDNKGVEINAPAPEKGESSGRYPDGKDTDDDSMDFVIFSTPTKGVSNSADVTLPSVELISPSHEALFNETKDVTLRFKARDNLATAMDCSLYVNNAKTRTIGAENDTEKDLPIESMEDGSYTWYVECTDGSNKGTSESRTFIVDAPSGPVIGNIGDKTVNEGQKVEFTISATNEERGSLSFSIENRPGNSSFFDNGNGSANFSWQTGFGDAGVYNVRFTVENENGMTSSKTVKIEVREVVRPLEFNDAPECELPSNMIDIDIREPDDGDDFDIGSKIDVEIKVKNNFEEDLEFNVEAHLYDVDEDKSVEDMDDSVDINEGDSETVKFELEVPDDVEDNQHMIYVYVESEDRDCTSDYIEVELDRENDNVKIRDLFLNPKVVYPGESVEVEIEVENIGGDDQDVVVKVEIPDLNISEESEGFEVEKFGDDDTESQTVRFFVPGNAAPREYEVIATISYSGIEKTQTDFISVLDKAIVPVVDNNAGSNVNNLDYLIGLRDSFKDDEQTDVKADAEEKPTPKTKVEKTKPEQNPLMLIIVILIAMGIVIEVIIIKFAMDK